RMDSRHHTVLSQEPQRVSDDTDVCQRTLLLDPRERRGLGLPVHTELPRGFDASRHPCPDAVLERVERLPERSVVLGARAAMVQHQTPRAPGLLWQGSACRVGPWELHPEPFIASRLDTLTSSRLVPSREG